MSKGKDNLAPLITLHGGPGSGHKNLVELFTLATDRKVYLYDQIGCGKSSKLNKNKYSIETFVEELKILKRKWGVAKFHLLGTSWGTTLALEYYLATHDPDCLSIIFQSPLFSAKDWQNDANNLISKLPVKQQKILAYCHEIGATDASVYKEAMKEYYKKHVCRNAIALDRMMKEKNPNGRDIYQSMWGPSEFKATGILKRYDRVSSLNKIKIPSLLICGKYDEARPETVRRYTSMIPNSTFSLIPRSSHVILKENPQPMLSSIKQHLNGVDSNQ